MRAGHQRALAGIGAALAWLLLVAVHGPAGALVAALFRSIGRPAAERLFQAAVILAPLLFAALAARRGWAALRPWLLPGLAWAGAALAIERTFIILHSELTHYLQYGLVGALLALATRRPTTAILIGAGLGLIDEGVQLTVLYADEPSIRFDWNDGLLNVIGTLGGVLAVLALRKERDEAQQHTEDPGMGPALAAGWLLLYGLGAAAWRAPQRPFWTLWILDGGVERVYHELGWGAGLMSFAALGLGSCALVSRGWTRRWLPALLAALLAVAPAALAARAAPPAQDPRLPELYAARAPAPPRIDGVLDDEAWLRSRPVALSHDRFNREAPPPTAAHLSWDESHLYLAFDCEDEDVWAAPRARDDPQLPGDEVVELFIDPDPDDGRWFELEVSPAGVVYDLRIAADSAASEGIRGDASWDSEVEVAVRVRGDLEEPGGDAGWTVELALPFASLGRRPVDGELWRVNLFRVERPRAPGAAPALLCWSPSLDASFHRPGRFGRVIFSSKRGSLRQP